MVYVESKPFPWDEIVVTWGGGVSDSACWQNSWPALGSFPFTHHQHKAGCCLMTDEFNDQHDTKPSSSTHFNPRLNSWNDLQVTFVTWTWDTRKWFGKSAESHMGWGGGWQETTAIRFRGCTLGMVVSGRMGLGKILVYDFSLWLSPLFRFYIRSALSSAVTLSCNVIVHSSLVFALCSCHGEGKHNSVSERWPQCRITTKMDTT